MDRKGSHVGFVLSFILFITFVIFMYVILSYRIDFSHEKENSLSYVKSEVMDRISGNMTSVSVSLSNPNPGCISLSDFFSAVGIGKKFIVINNSGSVLNKGVSASNLHVGGNGKTFFKVYSSEGFQEVSSPLSGCENSEYTIGLNKDSREIFESKVLQLLEGYTEDYEALKASMRIDSGDEFGLVLTYDDGTQIRTPEKNITTSVYVERTAIQYIKTNGARENGFIDVIIW